MTNMTTATDSAPLTESYWRKDESIPLIDDTVGSLLVRRAAESPTNLALVGTGHDDTGVRLTYAELLAEALRVATRLRELAGHEEMVALWAPNVAEWPVIQYGAALAGVVLVAVNPVLRAPELEFVLAHSGATVLIHADASRDHDMKAIAGQMRERFPALVTISLADQSGWLAEEVDTALLDIIPTDPDRPAMLQYTSGTTGNPKGVLLRHRSLVNVARLTMEAAGIGVGATSVNPLPMFHTAACVIGTLGPLWVGGTTVLVKQFMPAAVLAAMRDEQATVFYYVPAVLSAMVEYIRTSGEQGPPLDVMLGGASSVSAVLIESAESTFGGRVINVFGQTELAPVLTATRPDDSREDQLETVGRPLAQVDCKVVDPVTREVVPVGEVGEICARGYQQMIEYLGDAEITARTVDTDGFVHTGDLGSMDERGYLTVTGRLKELIIRGGENIAPAEIENRLLEVESVAAASVIGLPDDGLGEIVAAVVVLREPLDAATLRERVVTHVTECLAPFKVPARWFVTDALPLTPTGKVRKYALADSIVDGSLQEI
jgi:fatty-acyl-CoA synthase